MKAELYFNKSSIKESETLFNSTWEIKKECGGLVNSEGQPANNYEETLFNCDYCLKAERGAVIGKSETLFGDWE